MTEDEDRELAEAIQEAASRGLEIHQRQDGILWETTSWRAARHHAASKRLRRALRNGLRIRDLWR